MREIAATTAKKTTTKFFNLLRSDPQTSSSASPDSHSPPRTSTNTDQSTINSPYNMSPWNASSSSSAPSPFVKSPWIHSSAAVAPLSDDSSSSSSAPVTSLIRENGHLYSLAASDGLLYTGSDSKNIRVWKNNAEFSGFKSSSGLVKAIIISNDNRIFTGHQDGKIRVWNSSSYKRIGTLPKLKDFLKSSINPSNYVEVRRHKNAVWIKHFDAVSCLCLDEGAGLLYSGSWDKTIKVWRIKDCKCVESISAHDDAINSVAVGFDGLLFSGSADGMVKVWRREAGSGGGHVRHVMDAVLLRQDSAVTALAVSGRFLYCGSSDGAVNYWERQGTSPGAGELVYGGALRGHKMAVLCLVTAGGLVVSGSADRRICVWRRDGASGGDHERLKVLVGHAGPVKCLAVEEESWEDGGDCIRGVRRWVLYSGSLDKSVKVWRVEEEEGLVRRRTPRPW